MTLSSRCDACGQELSLPDYAQGQTFPCPNCGTRVQIVAPLMPPPMPGSEPQPPAAAPAPIATPIHTPAPIPRSAPPQSPPPHAPPVAPPPRRDGSPSEISRAGAEPWNVESHEAVELAAKLSRPNTAVWVVFGVLTLVLLILIAAFAVTKATSVNPPLATVQLRLDPADSALKMLADRQSGAGYSLLLPEAFAPASEPSTAGLPDGASSFAWKPAADSEDAGGELRIWVLPQKLDIKKALDAMDSVGSRLEYHADVTDKSSHRRIGKDMLAVRALLDGSTSRASRRGVIYIIADGNRTLLVIGMGAGQRHREVQFMLDHAIRTIHRAP